MFFWQPSELRALPQNEAEAFMSIGDPTRLAQGQLKLVDPVELNRHLDDATAYPLGARAVSPPPPPTDHAFLVRSLYELPIGKRFTDLMSSFAIERRTYKEIYLVDLKGSGCNEVVLEIQSLEGEEMLGCYPASVKDKTVGAPVEMIRGTIYVTNYRLLFVTESLRQRDEREQKEAEEAAKKAAQVEQLHLRLQQEMLSADFPTLPQPPMPEITQEQSQGGSSDDLTNVVSCAMLTSMMPLQKSPSATSAAAASLQPYGPCSPTAILPSPLAASTMASIGTSASPRPISPGTPTAGANGPVPATASRPPLSLVQEFPLSLVARVSSKYQLPGSVAPSRGVTDYIWGSSQSKQDDVSMEVQITPYFPAPNFIPIKFVFDTAQQCKDVSLLIQKLAFISPVESFAYVFQPPPPPSPHIPLSQIREELNFLMDEEAEFRRQGLEMTSPDCPWRLSDANTSYQLTPTYPPVLAIPRKIHDGDLMHVAAFRGKGRIPVLSWYSSRNGASLTRGSQPLVGMLSSRSQDDEKFLREIRLANNERKPLYVLDSRPFSNGMANKAKGGGYESTSYYEHCSLEFLNMPNIHAVRGSFLSMREACSGVRTKALQTAQAWLTQVGASAWLDNIRVILAGTARVVSLIEFEGVSVFVHCSDAWDRTAQLCSLAMLCLDPFFRTIKGFIVLIEREWIKMGHKFHDRMRKQTGDEVSPVFVQFIECVWQILQQNPLAFEFGEHFLLTIVEEALLGRFGTFLFNNDKERRSAGTQAKTPSLWEQILAQPKQYINPFFVSPTKATTMASPPARTTTPPAASTSPPPQMCVVSPRLAMSQMSSPQGYARYPSHDRIQPSSPTNAGSVILPKHEPQAVDVWRGFWGRYFQDTQFQVESMKEDVVRGLRLTVSTLESETRRLKELLEQKEQQHQKEIMLLRTGRRPSASGIDPPFPFIDDEGYSGKLPIPSASEPPKQASPPRGAVGRVAVVAPSFGLPAGDILLGTTSMIDPKTMQRQYAHQLRFPSQPATPQQHQQGSPLHRRLSTSLDSVPVISVTPGQRVVVIEDYTTSAPAVDPSASVLLGRWERTEPAPTNP